MSSFHLNPSFFPQMEEVLRRGLDDVGDEIVSGSATEIAPYSSKTAAAVNKDPAKGGSTPSVTVRMGRGLGPIFEFSKQRNRQTKAGANRGIFQRRQFFNKTVDRVVSKGLDLRRYL